MIEKNRLEELIKQGATIYDIFKGDIYFVDLTMAKYYDVPKYIEYKNDYYNCNLTRSIDDLFETKEDAEFALRYKHIPRIEYLDLPTWEEFKKCNSYIKFYSKKIRYSLYVFVKNKNTNNCRIMIFADDGEQDWFVFEKPLTKENYIEACEMCRKLFLGEVEE